LTNNSASLIIQIETNKETPLKKGTKKMKTYTEEEIKKYFQFLEETYKNCPFNEHVKQVEATMFNKDEYYTIDKVLKK